MFKQILISFTILSYYQIIGQNNYLIKYRSIKDSDTYMIGEDFLYFSPNKDFAIYYEGNNRFKDDRISKDSVTLFSGNYTANYFKENKLYFKYTTLDTEFKVEEEIPKFKWLLIDETKEKEGTILHKAETTFRGRNYTAWYNPEVPITIDPWKFNGLPGLIYEITDDALEYKYAWYLVSLENVKERTFRTNFKTSNYNIKQFVTEIDALYKNYSSKIDSRLLENFITTETKVIGIENQRKKKREIKYEWEE